MKWQCCDKHGVGTACGDEDVCCDNCSSFRQHPRALIGDAVLRDTDLVGRIGYDVRRTGRPYVDITEGAGKYFADELRHLADFLDLQETRR